MSLPPLEGSRDTGKGIIVSIYPDVCYAKKDPVPFSIYAIQGEDANTAASVRMTGQRAHNMASLTTCCHGDEPGVAGVKSGTILSICEPKTHSATVRIEGKHAIRHKDEWWMNSRNTIGKLNWVESTESFEPTPPIDEYRASNAEDPGVDPITTGATGGAAASAASAAPAVNPTPLPTPTQRPSAKIYNFSDYLKNAPKPPPAPSRWWKVLKWGKSAGGVVAFLGALLTPTNRAVVNDRVPADDLEQDLIAEAQRRLDAGTSRGDVYKWLDESIAHHRAQIQQPTEEEDAPPKPVGRTEENVSVRKDDKENKKCDPINLCFYDNGHKDFKPQLEMQEAALNNYDISTYVANRAQYIAKGTNAMQALAKPYRDKFRRRQRYITPGDNALHRLDMVAGGDYKDIARMGHGLTNQNIGNQWKSNVVKLDAHAAKLAANGCKKMAANLNICGSRPPSTNVT